MCGARRDTLSQCEMVTGPGFSSPNQPDQEPRPIVTAQGRNRVRMPIVLSLSAIGRSHLGNPGQMGNPVEIHAEGVLQCHLEAFFRG